MAKKPLPKLAPRTVKQRIAELNGRIQWHNDAIENLRRKRKNTQARCPHVWLSEIEKARGQEPKPGPDSCSICAIFRAEVQP